MEEIKMPSKKTMIKRRTETPLSPQQLFNQVLTSSLYWPGRTIRLERSSLLDYRQRSMSAHVSVAEFYHENSKLFPQMLPELTISYTQADELRREFLQRRAAVVRSSGIPSLQLDQCWQQLLTGVSGTSELTLFYAVELRFVVNDLLAAYEPLSDTLQVVKQFSASDLDLLRHALQLMNTSEVSLEGKPLLLVLGSFARNDVLFGPRGYRRTLLEAGRLAQEIVHQAEQLGLAMWPLYEFIDYDVDAAMEADGIEQSTIMAFVLGGSVDVK